MRHLYRILTIILCVTLCASASAQIRTVTFTGRDKTNQYHIPLHHVNVFNLDQLWEEVLVYPDTTLTMGTVGIGEHELPSGLRLMQNVPNPFDGTTEFVLILPTDNDVTLEIYDISGKLTVSRKFGALPAGSHLFRATLMAPQTYLLGATTRDGQTTIKMVNEGHGGENAIQHIGMTDANGDFTVYLKNERAGTAYPFNVGDEMKYIGYTMVDGVQVASNAVVKQQTEDETISFVFDFTLPSVNVQAITNLTGTTASCFYTVISDGGAMVSAHGICWSTSPNPTIENSLSHTNEGSGIGNFTSNITGLSMGTTYYVRAYATNIVGTVYGEQESFTTFSLPIVTTDTVSNITATTATCGGNVTDDGGASVTSRGVCWSTSPNPSLNSNLGFTYNNGGTGSFTSSITGLSAGTTYYVKAYATNSVGTNYGERRIFKPTYDGQPCPAAPTVTDHEGNVYATVQIGNQCWMRDNLRTTTSPSTGTYLIPDTNAAYTYTGKQARWYRNDSATYAPKNYGLLYNWNAAVDTFNTAYEETSVNTNVSNAVLVNFTRYRRGICPAGWHLPSDAEWNTMEATVSGSDWQTNYETTTGYRGNHAGKLAGGDNWKISTTSGAPGDYYNADHNVSGFSAVPAGSCTVSSFNYAGNYADFWCATQYSSDYAYGRSLYYSDPGVYRNYYFKNHCRSVRCLRDAGTAVVDEKSCSTAPTVTDHEGNVYATVQIGNQCWMRDNLRTTTSPSTGTRLIPPDTAGYTYTGKQARWYRNDSVTYAPKNYGLLYNWNAVVDTFNTAYGETSVNTSSSNAVSVTFSGHRRGICPAGWHLPSDAEWTQLTNYVSSQSEYTCSGNSSYIAKALASTEGWNSYSGECYPGDQSVTANNATGFSAVPAGRCNGSSFYYVGLGAYFWSSTQYSSYNAWYRNLYYNSASVLRNTHAKNYGFSVRCLRD